MFTKILYAGAAVWLVFSFFKDRTKTKTALKKAWKSFENILPSVLAILILIGFILTLLDAETISRPLGILNLAGIIVIAIIIDKTTNDDEYQTMQENAYNQTEAR